MLQQKRQTTVLYGNLTGQKNCYKLHSVINNNCTFRTICGLSKNRISEESIISTNKKNIVNVFEKSNLYSTVYAQINIENCQLRPADGRYAFSFFKMKSIHLFKVFLFKKYALKPDPKQTKSLTYISCLTLQKNLCFKFTTFQMSRYCNYQSWHKKM